MGGLDNLVFSCSRKMLRRGIVTLSIVAALATSSQSQDLDSLRSVLETLTGVQRVDALGQLAISIWWTNPDEGMIYAKEALEISLGLRDSARISKSLRLIASTYYYLGDYSQSQSYNQQSLVIASKIEDSALMSASTSNLGLLNYDLGNFELSVEYYLRSIDLLLLTNDRYGAGITYNNIGLVYREIKKYDLAKEYFEKGYSASVANKNKNAQVYSLNNLGYTFLIEGNLIPAKEHFSRANLLATEIDNINWGAVSKRNLGEIFHLKGQYDSASTFYGQSLMKSTSIGDKKGICETLHLLSKLAHDQGDIVSALDFLDQCHQIALRYNWRLQLLQNHRLYANIHLSNDDLQNAIESQSKYLHLQDSLYRDVAIRNIALIPLKLQEENDRKQIANQEKELQRREIQYSVAISVLCVMVPMVIILLMLLKKIKKRNLELNENNAELKQAKNLLVRSEKMASLGVLAAGVGHEINNPLNYIQNGIQAVSQQIREEFNGESEKLTKYFDIINTGVNRASAIVKSLGQFSRSDVDDIKECDLKGIIENCLVILENKLKKIEVVTKFSGGEPIVMGNEGRLHQVFMNLILNAGQAVEDNGLVTISVKTTQEEIVISVKDNGVGILKENVLKVSDPFFTTKPPGEGTGLGLFITYSIVEEHGGNVQLISKPNNGAEFIVTLPLNQEVCD